MNILLINLFFAHLIADFLLQKKAWIVDRTLNHWKSKGLWLHIAVHIAAMYVVLLLNFKQTLPVMFFAPLIIGVLHLLTDIWKSYKDESLKYFLLDQAVHIIVLVCVSIWLDQISMNLMHRLYYWLINPVTYIRFSFFVLATFPAGLIIARLTERWRAQLPENESLANAGMWIGILERLLIMIFITIGKFDAIGLLIAAKSLLRFADKDNRSGKRTEYILIGTLLSFSFTVILGLLVNKLITLVLV